MKTFLNILPPEKKRNLVLMRRYRAILSQGIGILFLVVFLNILLGGVWGLLFWNEKTFFENVEEKKRTNEAYADIALYEESFRQVRETLPKTSTVLENQKIGSKILRVLEQATNVPGMFTSLNVTGGEAKISGRAEMRDTLLGLQENLRAQSCFSEVVLPWSQMAQKENVDFDIALAIRPECLSFQ